MTTQAFPPIRVERALQLLPDLDALAALRSFLVSTSQRGGPDEPDRTVGKRFLRPTDLEEHLPRAVERVSRHLAALYATAVGALEAEQRGDRSSAVRALLRGGEAEERAGREGAAAAWYEQALRVAQELRDRRPEIEALRHLGRLQVKRGRLESGARYYQHALALAESEFDYPGASSACQGLAEVARAQGRLAGAESWYTRGLRYAEQDGMSAGYLHLGLATVARDRDQLEVAAEWLRRAREDFESKPHVWGTVLALRERGLLESQRGNSREALTSFREALALLHGLESNPRLEVRLRLDIAQLYFDWHRLPDAEDEIRRAEEVAISDGLTELLACLYLLLGRVRARKGDEQGFVFFEKAIELCRGRELFPRLEAEAYLEYALLRRETQDLDESRAYLERAHELLQTMGAEGPIVERVSTELARV